MNTSVKYLIESVLSELDRLHYAKSTISQYRTVYKKYARFVQEQGVNEHSVELGDRWLLERCGIDIAKVDPGSPKRTTKIDCYNVVLPTRAIQCLNEWMLFEHIPLKKQGKFAQISLNPVFERALNAYSSYCQEFGYAESGTITRLIRIKHMLIFFEAKGIFDLNEVTATIISDFIKTQIGQTNGTILAVLSAVRCFFRELYLQEMTEEDLSEKVPKLKSTKNHKLPRVWKTTDVQKLLASIDRQNPAGKRDYAILLIIARYGLRSMDVRQLKLGSLNWEKNLLTLVQSKTGKVQTFPLLHDVGWAIAEYLRFGRPKIESEYVFLTHTVPHRPFAVHGGSLNHMLARRVRAAGIAIPREMAKGMHALRHTLASTMLSQDVPLPVISSVLGHATMEATAIYLHTDLIRLKDCVIDPEEVLHANHK